MLFGISWRYALVVELKVFKGASGLYRSKGYRTVVDRAGQRVQSERGKSVQSWGPGSWVLFIVFRLSKKTNLSPLPKVWTLCESHPVNVLEKNNRVRMNIPSSGLARP